MSCVRGAENVGDGTRLLPCWLHQGEECWQVERLLPVEHVLQAPGLGRARARVWLRDGGASLAAECRLDGGREWSPMFRLLRLPEFFAPYAGDGEQPAGAERLRSLLAESFEQAEGEEPEAARERAERICGGAESLWVACWSGGLEEEGCAIEEVWEDCADFAVTAPDGETLLRAALQAQACLRGWELLPEE
jgi:hypothetical protein